MSKIDKIIITLENTVGIEYWALGEKIYSKKIFLFITILVCYFFLVKSVPYWFKVILPLKYNFVEGIDSLIVTAISLASVIRIRLMSNWLILSVSEFEISGSLACVTKSSKSPTSIQVLASALSSYKISCNF